MAPAKIIRKRPSPATNGDTPRVIKITITLDDHEKTAIVNPRKLPLIFMEALEEMQDGSWRNMRVGIQQLLKLTDEEAMALDTDHILQIASAVSEATDIPNG